MIQFFALVLASEALALQASSLLKDSLALHGFMVTTLFMSPRSVQATENIDLGTASPACLLQRNKSAIALELEEAATSEQTPPATCGGNAGGKPCKFPRIYKGVEYTQCWTRDHNRPWCFTEEDDWGNCDCGWTTVTTTTTTPQSLCSNIAGGVSSTYPCLCGITTAAWKECVNGQLCTASDDLDGVCKARGQIAPPANYDLVCTECDGCDGRKEFKWQLEHQRGQPWSVMHKKQGDFKILHEKGRIVKGFGSVLGPIDVRNCSMLASADPFCGLYFRVGDGSCYCDRIGYSCSRNHSGTTTRRSATDFWAYYRRKLPVCSNVAHGASSTYPCLCGSTTAAETVCAYGEFCTASNDSDGVCQMPLCSNTSGGPSSANPCLCGTSFAATTQCNSTELCTASNDTDGVCRNCQNTCRHGDGQLAVSDGFCDDGGPGLHTRECSLGTDCADCGARATTTTTPAPGTMLCSNTCEYAEDGVCDDTGPGSSNPKCNVGTDCTDCGARKAAMWTLAYKCAFCKNEEKYKRRKWDFEQWVSEQECADYCYSKKTRYMTHTPGGAQVGQCYVKESPCPRAEYREFSHGTCRCETPDRCTKLGRYHPRQEGTACPGNTFIYETTQRYTLGGCSTVLIDGAEVPNQLTTLLTDWEATAGVLCCSLDGKQCGAGNSCAEADNLQQAFKHCWKIGYRLCTLAEVQSDMCCSGTRTHGCDFDFKRVWTASKASVCSNRVGGASSTYPCICGLTNLASTVCVDGQVCTASNDSHGVCQEGPTPPPTPAPPMPSTTSSTPAPSGKCYSTVVIGKDCENRQGTINIPPKYRSSKWPGHSKLVWDASAGVYTYWGGSDTLATCRLACDSDPACNGYDFYPSSTTSKCATFSRRDCSPLRTSSHSDARHYQVRSCTSEQTTTTSTTSTTPAPTTPAPTTCACGDDMALQTKSYGNEISWEVKNAAGTVVCQSGAPGVYANYQRYPIDNCCLAKGSQFTLTCKDSFDDGWHGGSISMCGQTYCKSFSSGRSHSETFTTPGPTSAPTPAPTNCACRGDMVLQTKTYGKEISWEVKNAAGTVVCQSGAPGVYADHQRYPIKNCCLSDGIQYTLICKDSYKDGWHGSFISICGQRYCESFSSGGSSTKPIALSAGE